MSATYRLMAFLFTPHATKTNQDQGTRHAVSIGWCDAGGGGHIVSLPRSPPIHASHTIAGVPGIELLIPQGFDHDYGMEGKYKLFFLCRTLHTSFSVPSIPSNLTTSSTGSKRENKLPLFINHLCTWALKLLVGPVDFIPSIDTRDGSCMTPPNSHTSSKFTMNLLCCMGSSLCRLFLPFPRKQRRGETGGSIQPRWHHLDGVVTGLGLRTWQLATVLTGLCLSQASLCWRPLVLPAVATGENLANMHRAEGGQSHEASIQRSPSIYRRLRHCQPRGHRKQLFHRLFSTTCDSPRTWITKRSSYGRGYFPQRFLWPSNTFAKATLLSSLLPSPEVVPSLPPPTPSSAVVPFPRLYSVSRGHSPWQTRIPIFRAYLQH